MRSIEERLEQAAREVRDNSRRRATPPLPEAKAPGSRGWLVFAAAFTAVALGFGLIPLLTGNNGTPPGEATSTSMATTTVPVQTTIGQDPEVACSASGLPLPTPQEGLPAAVAVARDAIARAAVSCDFVTLESLTGPDFISSFGGGDFSNLLELEESGGELDTLVKLFDTGYAVQVLPEMTLYVWPAAFAYDTWDEIPATDLEAIVEIFGEDEVDTLAGFGSYAGWRIGITEMGDWRFFVAGD